MIRLDHVSLSFGEHPILKDISLSLKAKKIHVLLGPSGHGKSTLLKTISGIYKPTQGVIYIDDLLLQTDNRRRMAKKIGYSVQGGGLFPHLTARDNILLSSKLRKQKSKTSLSRLKELQNLVHVEDKVLDRYPDNLSGGEKQRISLMRALHCDPNILLMDEPLSSLDPMMRQDLKEELYHIFKALKKTVVFVTHDIFEASYLSDNVILMANGKIVQQGPFDKLLAQPTNSFVTNFIQSQKKTL